MTKKSKSNEFRSTNFGSPWGKMFVWNDIQVLIFGLTNGWRQRLATQAQKPHERQNLWWMCSDSWNLDLDDIEFLELVRPSSNGAGGGSYSSKGFPAEKNVPSLEHLNWTCDVAIIITSLSHGHMHLTDCWIRMTHTHHNVNNCKLASVD